eukprot:CAMPEP_0170571688 /NCGR_PEP_ID=MMETSP0224-20130122/1818_1 /TAXON_ID=285029 /ORGANISM="Togula jolla, Strain CCCM 725" /LENGTH=88 /DNA_ID=CAMNT_0010894131 /DNA_START=691 /DNA_END=957 /DNA_ORIENTATION=+
MPLSAESERFVQTRVAINLKLRQRPHAYTITIDPPAAMAGDNLIAKPVAEGRPTLPSALGTHPEVEVPLCSCMRKNQVCVPQPEPWVL